MSGVEHAQDADAGVEVVIVLSTLLAVNVEVVVMDEAELMQLEVLPLPKTNEDPGIDRSIGLRGISSLVSSSLTTVFCTIRGVDVGDSKE